MGFVIQTTATAITKFALKNTATVPLISICADISGNKPTNIPIAAAFATE